VYVSIRALCAVHRVSVAQSAVYKQPSRKPEENINIKGTLNLFIQIEVTQP